MDILDILLDILLKPPQPFIGLFLAFGIAFAIWETDVYYRVVILAFD